MSTTSTTTGTTTEKITLTTETEFPLSINSLTSIATFEHTPAGLSLVSKIRAAPGTRLAFLTSHIPQPKPSWRTIQTSATTHTDPRSALLYMNHSCAPTVEVHAYSPDPATGAYPTSVPSNVVPPSATLVPEDAIPGPIENGLAGEIRVARDRGIEPGEAFTFFYPSTEWKFDRAFDCLCGAEGRCLGRVEGAFAVPRERLGEWFMNEHILKLAEEGSGVGK